MGEKTRPSLGIWLEGRQLPEGGVARREYMDRLAANYIDKMSDDEFMRQLRKWREERGNLPPPKPWRERLKAIREKQE